MQERIRDAFTDFFNLIGINPYLGYIIILTVLVIFKIRSYLKKDRKDGYDKFYDIVFFIGAFALYIFFSLFLFGIIK